MSEQCGHSLRTQFGAKVREIREAQGLSLRKFSLMVDLSYPYLSKVENGKAAATIDVIEKIANGLGVKAKDLF